MGPLLTNDELANLEREAAEWEVNLAANGAKGEVGKLLGLCSSHSQLDPITMDEAFVEDIAVISSTSTTPRQWQHTFFSFSHRKYL